MAVDVCVTVAAAETLRLDSGVVPPMAPVNVVVPVPPLIVRSCAPLSVLLKVIAPAVVLLEIVLVPVMLTGNPNVRVLAPVTVMFAPTWMVFTLVLNTRLTNGLVPPTAPANETLPPVPDRKVNVWAVPLIVLADVRKLIVAPAAVPPALVVSMEGLFVNVIGPVMLTVPPEVVILPPTLMAVGPV